MCGAPSDVQEITVDDARTLGYAVDRDLWLFAARWGEQFHRSDGPCGDAGSPSPSVQGLLYFHAVLTSLSIYKNNPKCTLMYRALVDLETDDGSFSARGFEVQGSAPSDADYPSSLGGDVDVHLCAGSLRLWVDPDHATTGVLRVYVRMEHNGTHGTLVLLSSAGDHQSTGDGLFWPVGDPSQLIGTPRDACEWPVQGSPPGPQMKLMTVDEFNRL